MCVHSICAAALLVTVAPALALPTLAVPAAAGTWTTVNESNVWGDDYTNPHVTKDKDAKGKGPAACQAACTADAACHSYTYDTGDAAPDASGNGCEFTGECYLRADTVWHPKQTKKCNAVSGYNGAAPPPSPSPPGPAPGPGPSPPAPPTPPPPPGALNVLFVIFDDLRPNSKAWGLEQPSMPNVDALAAKSLTFDHAYCNQAVCGPSRASLLSGRRPDSTQMWNFKGGFRKTPGAAAWKTWPEWARTHGWTSYGCGKLYHPDDPANFDAGRSWTEGKWGGYNGQGGCGNTSWEAASDRHGCALKAPIASHDLPDNITLHTALGYLEEARQEYALGKKFWLGVGFVKPHMPQAFPEEFLAHVPAEADIILAKNQSQTVGTSSMEWSDGAEESTWEQPFPAATQQGYRRGYYAAAAYSDSLFGILLASLEEKGFSNNTIVIMTADHGWGLGEHNHWIKYTNYETDARIPLIVHAPHKPATWGTRQAALVEHVDLYPTISELMGAPVPVGAESIEGASYASLFESVDAVVTKDFTAAYIQYPRCNSEAMPITFLKNERCASVAKSKFKYMGYSIRTPLWRFTEYAAWDGKTLCPQWNATVPCDTAELYDHAADDGMGTKVFDDFENVNLAFEAPHLSTVQQLSAQLRAFYKSKRCPN